VFQRGEKMQLTYAVRNTERSIGARTSSAIVRQFGADGLSTDHLTIRLSGSAGQSLGCFGAKGLRIELDGDANDYVGKGLSGATIIVRPFARARDRAHEDAIIGNTCLYGATSGLLFAAGRAGARFAVRNSGAVTVVEGCGANGCEYMTGGVALILGAVGDNFAAGMTGGRAFVFDEDQRLDALLNPDSVEASDLCDEDDRNVIALLEKHRAETKSRRADALLSDWTSFRRRFVAITPKEVLRLREEAKAAATR
jgi:glutamate synthase (NADPH/NADH) large chain